MQREASAVIRMEENQSAANRERVLCWRSQIQRRKRGTRCFLAFLLQVRAGRRKCVSSAALCTQRYRTHRQGETGWRERVRECGMEREREWEVPDSEREGEGEGDICPAPAGFSRRATREVSEPLLHSISSESESWRESDIIT